MDFCCKIQLQKDSSNTEAQDQLGKLQGLRDNIEEAKSLISRQFYAEAVEMLSKPIEVSLSSLQLNATKYIHGQFVKERT